jgi:dihydroorotate dehydrogenase (fumarate)
MELTASYLGLSLAHPFIAGASPLSASLDMVKRLEDGGAAALVLPSLFEEQVTMAESGRIHQMDPADAEFAEAVASFPLSQPYAQGPDEYLDYLRRVRAAVRVPVIASLNGMTGESWLKIASSLEEAGADAVELNIDEIPLERGRTAIAVESDIRNIVVALKDELRIPVALKLSPFFTAFAQVAHKLDAARVDGLVLFNRFNHPDIDVHHVRIVPRMRLSSRSELPIRLHWAAVLSGTVRASIAITGGVASPDDGIKCLLAGADAVQMVSAILRHGPSYFHAMRDGLSHWADVHQYGKLSDVRGRLSLEKTSEPILYHRANYLRTLQSWTARSERSARRSPEKPGQP